MFERSVWPDWLRNLLPDWLEEVSYPAPGVGDQNDLKFALGVGDGGKWIGFVNSGWFYHDNLEQYNYLVPGVAYVAATSGTVLSPLPGYTVSTAVSGTVVNSVSYRPSWGPVLVSSYVGSGSTNNYQPYIQHHNSFSPGNVLSWTASGSIYFANLPSSSLLVGMRDLTQLAMGSVSSSGQLLSDRLFYYDRIANRVWVKPPAGETPQCWADIVYYQPNLKFREVVTNTVSGVKASYRDIENITCFRGNQVVAYSGAVTGGAYFTPPVTGISTGDWVGLEYYVTRSFVLKDHKTLQYYVTATTSGEHFTITHETSLPDLLPNARLTLPVAQQLNFNPLFSDSFRSGFLFHSVPGSGTANYWTPTKLRLFLDKKFVCEDYGEPLYLSVYLYGDNGLPLPHYPFTLTMTGTASTLTSTAVGSSILTDGRGEYHALIKPASGSAVFSVTGSVSTFTTIASAQVLPFTDLMNTDKWGAGFTGVLVTEELLSNGSHRTFVGATNLDGVPRAAQGSTAITLQTKKASEITVNNINYQKTAVISTTQSSKPDEVGAFTEVGYRPQPNDEIVSYSADGHGLVLPGQPNNEI